MSAVWLFVYGSLRRDAAGNHHPLLAQARFVGHATVPGALYRVTWYPGLVPDEDGTVHGELYELPLPLADRMLQVLDDYEGGGFRRRKVVATLRATPSSPDGSTQAAHASSERVVTRHDAWVYTYVGALHALERIASGDHGVAPQHRAQP